MKKMIAVFLTLVLVMGNCMVVFGAETTKEVTGTSNDGKNFTYKDKGTDASSTNYQEVTATYSDAREIVYSVDISWGNMQFTYSDNATGWDPDTHTYSTASVGWNNKTKTADNTVTIVNHSNARVRTKFGIKDNEEDISMPGANVKLYVKNT